MITKIISGGQTGADQGALDAAIALGIPHGGWIPKGRITEDGFLPESYTLLEMPTSSYEERTEQNVIDSDGTLILSHGKLTGGSAYTRALAEKHDRPCLHTDLNKTPAFQTAADINAWVQQNNIEVLNVAGPRRSKDPMIYQNTKDIIESVCRLDMIHENMPGIGQKPYIFPKTVDESVERLINEMPLKDKVTMANMTEDELASLVKTLGRYIRNRFGLLSLNDVLMESCRLISNDPVENAEEASMVIIRTLYKKLYDTHKLKIVR